MVLQRGLLATCRAVTHFAGPRILDGGRLAGRRAADLARRAARAADARGRPPALAVIATAVPGTMPRHVSIKQRAADAIGVATRVLAIAPDSSGEVLLDAIARAADDPAIDGIFVQFPLPAGVRDEEVLDEIPLERDVDVMSGESFRRFLDGVGPAPATAEAAFLLLDAHDVDVRGRVLRVVGAASPLADAFEVLAARRGAEVRERVEAGDPSMRERLADAHVVAALIGSAGELSAAMLPAGVTAIDGGYFNPGARGDIDASSAAHVAALVPVPGGLGPMTVSVLLERTIERAGG